jgi:hypothetical protein
MLFASIANGVSYGDLRRNRLPATLSLAQLQVITLALITTHIRTYNRTTHFGLCLDKTPGGRDFEYCAHAKGDLHTFDSQTAELWCAAIFRDRQMRSFTALLSAVLELDEPQLVRFLQLVTASTTLPRQIVYSLSTGQLTRFTELIEVVKDASACYDACAMMIDRACIWIDSLGPLFDREAGELATRLDGTHQINVAFNATVYFKVMTCSQTIILPPDVGLDSMRERIAAFIKHKDEFSMQ